MNSFITLWEKIQNEKVEYYEPDGGYSSCDVYIYDDYVFKQAPDNQKANLWKSKDIINNLYNQDVQVPEVLFSSKNHNLVVYEKINGSDLTEITDKKFAGMSGDILRSIHNLQSKNAFGEIYFEEDDINGKIKTPREYVNHTIEMTNYHIPENSIFYQLFRRIEKRTRDIEVDKKNTCLCHFNYNMRNIICNGQKCYTIDFMDAELSFPAMDVIYLYMDMKQHNKPKIFSSTFLDAYGKSISELSDIGLHLGTMREVAKASIWKQRQNENRDYDFNKYHKNISEFADKHIFNAS
jgi:tRNA A-37 threonylcarbamoyl transferase component Bud32